MSRILSGVQEPKLRLAYDLAKALGVTLDYLVDDSPEVDPNAQLVMVTEDELTILKIVRRLSSNVSIDRLLAVPTPQPQPAAEPRPRPEGQGPSAPPMSANSGSAEGRGERQG
jgi:transcriptional regulator with XRE-family HTH domain